MSDVNGYNLMRTWFGFAFENPSVIRPVHGALYAWLVELNNRRGWAKEFAAPASECMCACGIASYNTYKSALNELVDFGFVQIKKASRNQYMPNVIALSKNNKAQYKAIDKALSEQSIKLSESTGQSTDSILKQGNSKPLNKEQETAASLDEINLLFDQWWESYDYKVGKAKSKSKWGKLSLEQMTIAIQVTPKYVASTPDTKYRKHPFTWLGGEHWEDELPTLVAINEATPGMVKYRSTETGGYGEMEIEKWMKLHEGNPGSMLKRVSDVG